jgi:dTDP-glucose 4,6-dehydratase
LNAGESVLVCDAVPPGFESLRRAEFRQVDIRDPARVASVPIEPGDVVYHLAARQYHLAVPRRGRGDFFDEVNVAGTRHVLEAAFRGQARGVVFFSTDMVYGIPEQTPVGRDHPRRPLGPYGASKRKAEDACDEYRQRGLAVTVLRPRLILGPGRLGVLAKLFRLIRRSLPVPLIGSGHNRYQMVSVHDCVSAALCAVARGIPDSAFNLGSKNPPRARELLEALIRRVGSRSVLVPTPAGLMKGLLFGLDHAGLTVLYPEQFLIADLNYIVDTTATERELGWAPAYSDHDMMFAAYDEFCKRDDSAGSAS